MVARKYEQRLRAESADETRRRILDALCERLRLAPAEPVSIDRVAGLAGVARATVYLVFGSRAGLFYALGVDLLERGGFEDVLRASADPDALKALRGGIRSVVSMYAADRDIHRALGSMAQLDAEAVGGAVHRMEEGRAGGMTYLAERLAEQGVLRADVSVDEAANLLWVLTSFETFDLLFTGRAVNVDKIAQTLITTAERSLSHLPGS